MDLCCEHFAWSKMGRAKHARKVSIRMIRIKHMDVRERRFAGTIVEDIFTLPANKLCTPLSK
jgi:hypothetical protein